jgi:hypothetical protein
MSDALGYELFGDRLYFFWHQQFRILFPDHPQPLRMMSWEAMAEEAATCLLLGWDEAAIYEGYLAYAALNREYQLQFSYDQKHRRGHVFILRLFSAWRGDVSHEWPSYAYDEPIYEGILERWREPDPELLKPWLLAACDRHTHEAQPDTEEVFHDFSGLPREPLEILFLFRLRERLGLLNPVLDHPLMESPFDHLPTPQAPYIPDDLMRGTLKRIREDWPQFDEATSLAAIRR